MSKQLDLMAQLVTDAQEIAALKTTAAHLEAQGRAMESELAETRRREQALKAKVARYHNERDRLLDALGIEHTADIEFAVQTIAALKAKEEQA